MHLVIGIAILYVVGFITRWNYSLWWYDWMLHFFGGIWVAIVTRKFFVRPISQIGRIGPMFIIAFVALVGVTWEIYEFAIDELFFEERALWRAQEGNTDTMTDLMMDLLGGVAAAGYMTYRSYKSDRSDKNL